MLLNLAIDIRLKLGVPPLATKRAKKASTRNEGGRGEFNRATI